MALLAGVSLLNDVENKTELVYSLIRSQQYKQAAELLETHRFGDLCDCPRSVLSLLGHCYFADHQFDHAADVYAALADRNEQYRVYECTSLWKAGRTREALRQSERIHDWQTRGYLTSVIHYHSGELDKSEASLKTMGESHSSVERTVANGCLQFQRGDLMAAYEMWKQCQSQYGFDLDLYYNLALVCFELGRNQNPSDESEKSREDWMSEAHSFLREVQRKGEWMIEKKGASIEDSRLRQAHTLQLAMSIQAMSDAEWNTEAAKEQTELKRILESAQPWLIVENDHNEIISDATSGALTICQHNLAVAAYKTSDNENDKQKWMNEMQRLVREGGPSESVRNCAVMCVENGIPDAAKDVIAEFGEEIEDSGLSEEEEIDWRMIRAVAEGENGRSALKEIQSAALTAKHAHRLHDSLLRECELDWISHRFEQCEKHLNEITHISYEKQGLSIDSFFTRLNHAHLSFMRGDFDACLPVYESLLNEESELGRGLRSNAMLIANLSVCMVMASRNTDAEELMQKCNQDEQGSALVKLAIGTLYCTQSNFHFGLSQINEALKSVSVISDDIWFHSKSALLAFAQRTCDHSVLRSHATLTTPFLSTVLFPMLDSLITSSKTRVSHKIRKESRFLRALFLRLLCP